MDPAGAMTGFQKKKKLTTWEESTVDKNKIEKSIRDVG